ncbi:YicC/YloC family endoribonuclease [Devosia sp.]|uniref:YicC/YloC family endoribonuclease n=1 Tax=Devosia sp. TaxID=1871048 RepID=UPI002F203A48
MTGLASMTGYARAGGTVPGIGFLVEIRSVNARGLDIRLRLPPGFDLLEGEIRRRIGATITRGSIAFTLTVDREGADGRVVINKQALGAVLAALEVLSTQVDAERPRLDGILGLKGVLEQHESPLSETEEAGLHAAILAAVDTAVADLAAVRRQEGQHLGAVLAARIDEIAALAKAAEVHPARNRDAILLRLRQQIGDLVAAGAELPEDRLAQEALLLATKADIREELDRLQAHIAAARRLLAEGGPVGRKLDFLSQEFNREANTLCAKSNAVELTGIGLDLKAVIDQLREQVQNIE